MFYKDDLNNPIYLFQLLGLQINWDIWFSDSPKIFEKSYTLPNGQIYVFETNFDILDETFKSSANISVLNLDDEYKKLKFVVSPPTNFEKKYLKYKTKYLKLKNKY